MSDPERLKRLLDDAKRDLEQLEDWMKSQEPAPGVSYQEWERLKEEAERNRDKEKSSRRIAGAGV